MVASDTSVKPWVRVILIFPAFLIVVVIFQFLGYAIQGLDPVHDHFIQSPVQQTIDAFFTLFGTVLLVWIFAHFIDKIKLYELGFYPKDAWRQLALGFVLGIILLGLGFITLLFFDQILWKYTNLVLKDLLIEICLFILVAFSEELLSRGYVLKNLMQSLGKGWALIISAFMFSLFHILNPDFTWIGFCNIVLAGILLGLPYIYTRQLWLPIGLHFSWNFFQGPIFGFNVSGQAINTLIGQTRVTDTIWNGGKFGFEGSVICTLMQIIAIVGLWWYYHQKEAVSSEAVAPEVFMEADGRS